MCRTILVLCGLFLLDRAAAAQQPRPDPIGENLFPPELIMQHEQEIGLTEEQKDFVGAQMREAQTRFMELQEKLRQEVEAMGDVLKQERPDEHKVLAQLDKVLDAERQIKRAHLALMLGIRNKLTSRQQAQIREIKQKLMAETGHAGPPESLQAKMQKVQQRVKQWQTEGRDLSEVGQIMQEFQPLMNQGKFQEAEELVDRALKVLQGEPKPKEKEQSAIPANPLKTPQALKADIEAMQAANVAWRQIQWKSCLLEGLKESRETHKPVLLWVFIDRPADDGRC